MFGSIVCVEIDRHGDVPVTVLVNMVSVMMAVGAEARSRRLRGLNKKFRFLTVCRCNASVIDAPAHTGNGADQ